MAALQASALQPLKLSSDICAYLSLAHLLALCSSALKTSSISGFSPAHSSGVFFSSQSEERIWCLRVPIRESRPSEAFDAWQSSNTSSLEASAVSRTGPSFSSGCSDDLLWGNDVELTIAALSDSLTDCCLLLFLLAPWLEAESLQVISSVNCFMASFMRFRPERKLMIQT